MPEENDLLNDIDKMLDSEEFWAIDVSDEMVMALTLAYTDGLMGAAEYIGSLKGIQLQLSFKVVDPAVLEFIDEHAAEMVRNINKGTRYYLRSMIYGGVEEGIPEGDLINGIMENLFEESDFSEKRVRSIARFEIANAQTYGWEKQMEEVGLDHKQWSTIGKDACPVCPGNEAMGPQKVGSKPYDNVFGEKVGGPPAHPNYCRCHLDAIPGEVDKLGDELSFFTG